MYLVSFRQKLLVTITWFFNLVRSEQRARIIIGDDVRVEVTRPHGLPQVDAPVPMEDEGVSHP